jgi:hypothetical protein
MMDAIDSQPWCHSLLVDTCVVCWTIHYVQKKVTYVIIIIDKSIDEGWKTWHPMGYGLVWLFFIFLCLVLTLVVECLQLEGLKEQHDSRYVACSLVHN